MGIVDKIKQLEGYLKAEIVVQEERGHDEVIPGSDRGSGPCSFDKVWDYDYIIDKPRIAHPDTETRESARQELHQILDNSKWYQPIRRYLCKRALS